MGAQYEFSVVVWREEELWIGQFVEMDVSVQAEEREELVYEVERHLAARALVAHQEGLDDPFDIPPPPAETLELATEGPFPVLCEVTGPVVSFADNTAWRVV